MGIELSDLKLLLELDKDPRSFRTVEAEEKLRSVGFLDENLDLTADGVDVIERVKEALAKSKRGIPFHARKTTDPKKVREIKWLTGSISKKPVMTDRSALIVGVATQGLITEKGDSELRLRMPSTFAQMRKGNFEEVFPVAFQTDGEIDPFVSLIWLSTNDRSRMEAVQAKYFDYLTDRFKNTRWWLDEVSSALKVTTPAGGLTSDHIVAFVMGYRTHSEWPTPEVL